MGVMKQLWVSEVEAIFDAYIDEKITRDDALKQLRSKGYDQIDAENEIDAIDEENAPTLAPNT